MDSKKKIKILYTIPNFNTAGSGKHLLTLINHLNKEEFEPQIACQHERGILFKSILKTNIKIHLIKFYFDARPILYMLKQCYKLSRVFKKINPDIIHSYNYAADYTEPLAARMAGIKWVYTKKNMSWEGPSLRGWRLRTFLANGITAQNSDMMMNFFKSNNNAKLIPMGINIKKFRKKRQDKDLINKLGLNEQVRIIISVANLVPVKGIEVLITAFENLYEKYSDWLLIIVGNDESKYGLELKNNISKNKELDKKVIFTGEVNNVRSFLSISEIYVQPTLDIGRKEGGPISTLEAMANGKIILGSNISGIRDQLLKKFPDYLFEAGNIFELQKKLNLLMSNSKKKNHKLGMDFLDHVQDNYSANIQSRETELFYNNLIYCHAK